MRQLENVELNLISGGRAWLQEEPVETSPEPVPSPPTGPGKFFMPDPSGIGGTWRYRLFLANKLDFKTIRLTLLALFLIAYQPTSFSEETGSPQTVEIVGQHPSYDAGAGGGAAGGCGVQKTCPSLIQGEPGLDEGKLDLLAANGDIRCAASSDGIKKTTSRSGWEQRYLAAIAVLKTLTLTGRMFLGKTGFLKVTYADGGTENWTVPAPMLSDGGMSANSNNSLVQGDGIPKPKTCFA